MRYAAALAAGYTAGKVYHRLTRIPRIRWKAAAACLLNRTVVLNATIDRGTLVVDGYGGVVANTKIINPAGLAAQRFRGWPAEASP